MNFPLNSIFWVSIFECPYQIHSDKGPNISGSLVKDVCLHLGIKKTTSSPYRPKSNGLIERLFKATKEGLRVMLHNSMKNKWPEKLPNIEFSLRSIKQSTTNFSPYEVVFEREIRNSNFIDSHLKQNKRFYFKMGKN